MQNKIEFRFLQLNKMQAITLSREIQGATYAAHEHNSIFIGSVPLHEKYLDDINHFFIRQKVVEAQCDILISTQSAVANTIINVPPIVNRILKDIDCPLTISLTLA
ncbi:hypothetical protein [Flavobacterium sp. W21_SRS_FM6]|uniref:hypothetical protein n=1 Tax=Flavobacterium sp. W21_SRS_FM6 TaxID=3240268 RepID=UPI003F8F61C4